MRYIVFAYLLRCTYGIHAWNRSNHICIRCLKSSLGIAYTNVTYTVFSSQIILYFHCTQSINTDQPRNIREEIFRIKIVIIDIIPQSGVILLSDENQNDSVNKEIHSFINVHTRISLLKYSFQVRSIWQGSTRFEVGRRLTNFDHVPRPWIFGGFAHTYARARSYMCMCVSRD